MPKYYDFMICGYYLYLSWRIIKERCILLAQQYGQAEDTPFSFYLPQPQTFSPKSLHLSEEKRIFAEEKLHSAICKQAYIALAGIFFAARKLNP